MMSLPTTVIEPSQRLRRAIEKQVEKFLAKGGQIKVIPRGVSGLPTEGDSYSWAFNGMYNKGLR